MDSKTRTHLRWVGYSLKFIDESWYRALPMPLAELPVIECCTPLAGSSISAEQAVELNPARSIGPGLVSGELHEIWIYIVAPIAGAAVGALAYQLVRGEHQA